ncbi:MAG TPA: cytochrome b/b6 domain-containing protein [Steroidobacteraceae bacterium]|nr:cytochrome b/b6 domain-containing protein [Steroidobacteraceae bacterium]
MSTPSDITPSGVGEATAAAVTVAAVTAAAVKVEATATASTEKRLVWDLPLRAFHWLFAASILASWATAEPGSGWMPWHMRLGYWMMGLLTFRILWGFVGPRHARFTSFLAGPRAMWRYFKGLVGSDEAIHTVGHNPLGGLMVIVMLLLVAFQVGTGLFATDDIVWTGPYNPAVTAQTARLLTSLHHKNFNLIWAAIALHVGAITYYAFVKKQNLVPAMLSGWKPAEAVPAGEAITSSELWKALIVMILSTAAVYAVLSGAPPASSALNFD